MLIVTTNGIPGYRVEAVLGAVMGMTVRGSSLSAGLRGLADGESADFTKLVYDARSEALNRLWGECVRRGGTAVVALHFDTGEVGSNNTEFCAYGTAVVVTPIPEGEPGATPQSIARAAAANPGPGNWPRMEGQELPDQGVRPPEFGVGQRPQARNPAGERPQPQAAAPGYAPAEHQRRLKEQGDAEARRAAEEPTRERPGTPQEQRANSGDSWLDLH